MASTTASNVLLSSPHNINISAYRVLYIMLMLVRYKSLSLVELNRHLFENPLIGRGYNNETLSKYIFTLRLAGCDIPRASNRNDYRYELLHTPFPLRLNTEEIEIIGKLLATLSQQSDERLAANYRNFLDNLSWSVDTSTWPTQGKEQPTLFYELAHRRALLKRFRQYCREAFHLRLDYRSNKTPSKSTRQYHVEPQEVIQRENQLFLLALDCTTQESLTLDLTHIEHVQQLPSKNQRTTPTFTVTFALYGRLAKSYRLYPDESITYQSEEELHIRTRIHDPEILVNRLMKYGDACQLLSPERLRETMRERITTLIHCLDEPFEMEDMDLP